MSLESSSRNYRPIEINPRERNERMKIQNAICGLKLTSGTPIVNQSHTFY
jgi:hypothetical protein